MKNIFHILDYYYLVLLRGYGRPGDYYATGMMQFTITINLFSLSILIYPYFLVNYVFFIIGIFIIGIVIYSILNIIYNKKRREKIIIQYKRENRASRQRGVVNVVVYEVLSVAFLILAIFIASKIVKF